MAYTAAPETQTYGTQRIPLIHSMDVYAGPTDLQNGLAPGMVNVLPFKVSENGDETVRGETRYGLKGASVFTSASLYCSVRGMYVWEKTEGTTYYYVVFSDPNLAQSRVYTSTDGTTWAFTQTLTVDDGGPVRFVEFISDTNVKSLLMVDGTNGYVFTSNAAGTKITDPDFPSPHVRFPIFLNGRIHLAKKNTGDIYCSDLNDPSSWTAGNYISAEVYPDDITALVKINNYILAVGKQGCEYFYDAANSTGSPLARYDGAALPFGCQIPNSISANNDTVCFLATNFDGESSLKIIEGFRFKEIPARFLLNLLNPFIAAGTTNWETVRGFFFRQKGELFYGLAFHAQAPYNLPTFAYSFSTGMWTQLQAGDPATSTRFPVYYTAPSITSGLYTFWAGHYNYNILFGTMRSDATSGGVDTIPTSSDIYQELRTPSTDFGTSNLKTMHRLGVDYSVYNGSTETDIPYVATNDTDFRGTWGTARRLAASVYNQFPFLTQLGAFRRRAFKVYCSGGVRIWRGLEVDINKGQQ